MNALSRKQRWAAIGVFAILATVLTFALTTRPFGYSSVCDRCGAVRYTKDWQLPRTDFTVFTYSRESDSPLSRVLLTNGILSPHPHHWLFVQGGGNGVRCAIGKGSDIRSAAESGEFAALVLMLDQRGHVAFRDRLLRGVFDPETSGLFRSLGFTAPNATMPASEVQGWIAEQSEFLNEMVTASKKR